MIHFPILRWGQPYKSLEVDKVVHFATGEPLAEVSQANGGLIARDMRQAQRARDVLREIPCKELIAMLKKAADLFLNATLPVGDGTQTPEEFAVCQSATTGLPLHMVRLNMTKLHYVLSRMDEVLAALMRNLDFEILTRGYGEEDGVMRSYQANAPVLGLVLPSNSPGVHALWLPVIPLQIGLVLKSGPQEPWTPFRMAAAFFAAGVPREAICIYPGGGEVGAAVLQHRPRNLIFGSTATVEQYRGNPRVRVHGPGFSKILLGDDEVDNWEKYLDLMVDSVLVNSGRGCINCSGIWVSRHGRAIAEAMAQRLGPIAPLPPDHPESPLAAFTVVAQAESINAQIESGLQESGVEDVTAKYRNGDRLVKMERCAYLRPTVIYCAAPDRALANTEYLFPFCSVVECPQEKMLDKIGSTLVCTAITNDEQFRRQLLDATHIDRLNLGPIPTIQLNWLQPHEGNIVDFLFRARAFQLAG
ncbi:MAG: aldehyde dehydrogenase family protein [Abditibacteriales bacterium]|nr:aldehyde dehydrogenase family protein [Abditibacteriales bacterium]MDW8366794.1 aldehyde dehydrogenase family protein [Abditibacteriales bacterium]